MLTLQHFKCLFNIVLNLVLNIGENDKYFISGLFFLSKIYRSCYLSLWLGRRLGVSSYPTSLISSLLIQRGWYSWSLLTAPHKTVLLFVEALKSEQQFSIFEGHQIILHYLSEVHKIFLIWHTNHIGYHWDICSYGARRKGNEREGDLTS